MPHVPAELLLEVLYLALATLHLDFHWLWHLALVSFSLTSVVTLNIPSITTPVSPLPHGGVGHFQPYNPPHGQPYNPAAVAYKLHQRGGEEEQDVYYRGYHWQFNYGHHGYHPGNSEDVELRSPGVVRRFSQSVVTEEN